MNRIFGLDLDLLHESSQPGSANPAVPNDTVFKKLRLVFEYLFMIIFQVSDN
jgi:hypothetical protein